MKTQSQDYRAVFHYAGTLEQKLEFLSDTFKNLPKKEQKDIMMRLEHLIANLKTFYELFALGNERAIFKVNDVKLVCMQDQDGLIIRLLKTPEPENKDSVKS